MAKNIFKNPQRRANLRHYGHDLSFRRDFTCSCGQLLPVMWDFLNPNESVRINDSVFARTQPLLSAAFARCTLHTYYFFVPIYQLDPYFENSFFGISDFHDSLTPVGDVPIFTNGTSPKGPLTGQSILMSNIKKAMFSLSAPTGGTTGFYINDVANDLLYVFGSDKPERGVDEFGIPIPYNIVRLLDLIGYGSEWLSQVTGDKIGISPNAVSVPSVNVLPLQAYQKIFFDFFRNTQYTSSNPYAYNAGYAMKSSNTTDSGPGWSYDYSNIYTGTSTTGINIYNGLFKLRYHPMKKDFFTSIQPTPLFNVMDEVQGYNDMPASGGLNSYVLSAYGVQLQGPKPNLTGRLNNMGVVADITTQGGNISLDYTDIGVARAGTSSPDMNVASLQQLRLMYAYDKLLQITGRAGKHIDDQTEAHFGVRPSMDTGECIYLGAHHTPLRIGEVIATADGQGENSSSTLGQIAGRGLASSGQNRTIQFRTKRHGVLMAIFSIVPDIDYKDNGLDIRLLRNSIMQWPRPVFDNLGMQPLYRAQSRGVSSFYNTSILGWQYRYSEEKLSYDKVNGAFLYTLAGWVPSIVFGQFGTTDDSSFYVPPTYLDSIFALSFAVPRLKGTIGESQQEIDHMVLFGNADGDGENPFLTSHMTCERVYERDPFLVCMDFDYKKSSWMSTYSLPNL